MKKEKIKVSYKEKLECSKSLLDIQRAYEEECNKRYLLLQRNYPNDFVRLMITEHMAIWLAAEKLAISKFGFSKRHWVTQKI